MLARARSLTLLYCFQKGIELSISFIVGIHTYAGEAAHMGDGELWENSRLITST